jgi:hypothetical protein
LQDYEIVLEIPVEATDISFGVLLYGNGSVWLSQPRIETVPSYVLLGAACRRLKESQ